MQTQTYKAGVSPKFLDHITNFFGRDYANIGYELIQNSWRAGANQVDVEFITEPVYGKSDRVILKVRDNGHGTDFSKILQAGESGWGESVVKEHPAGMGLFSLVGILGSCDVELVSVTKNKRFETDLVREHFTGQQILNVSSSESKEEEHTTLIISCDYDSRNTVAALKSIVTAIVEAALHCHPDKFDPYNNYVKVHCSVDTTSEAKFLFAGAYALLDAEGKPKLDLHKEEQDVVPGVDVYRTNLQNHGPTYYCVAVMNGSFIELAGGSGCIVPYRGIKPFPVADIYLEHNRSTNFVYHGKSISLGVSGDYLENDVATSELIRDLNDRNGNKGGTFWETQNRFSASEVKRPKVCNVIFIKDAAVMPMTHPERNSFVASDDTSRTIRKLVNHLYGMYRDDIKNAYHERQPGKDVIHRHLLDADMMTKWRFCRAIKCVSSCHSAPASLVSYVSSDIYRKEGTFQVVTVYG